MAHQANQTGRPDGDRRGIRSRAAAAGRLVFPRKSDLLALIPATLAALAAIAAVLPPRSGLPSMALVFEPHLFIASAVLLAPLAVWGRARTLAAAITVVMIAGGCLFGSEWISLPGSGAARHDISVMTWNVQYGTRTPADQAAQLENVTADLVALMEVEQDASDAIAADSILTSRFPYRALAPRPGAWGLAILSRYPISGLVSTEHPSCLDLTVTTPTGKVHVIAAHPVHAAIDTRTPLRLPVGYDPTDRDRAIGSVRTRIDAALAAGDRLLVLGDYNTTPSEPEYAVLSRGLRDTHTEVGEGPGWTWRPSRIDFLPFGFLRIDLQMTAGAIRPAATSIDCSLPGDHCRLFGDYEID